jgi:hypothetical protein
VQSIPSLMLVLCCAAPVVAAEAWTLPVQGGDSPDARYIEAALSVGHQARPDARFVDGANLLTYGFNTRGLTRLRALFRLGNNFSVRVSAADRRWTEVLNAMAIHGRDRHDGEVNAYSVDLTSFLPADQILIRFGDASRADGWGAYLTEITLDSDAPAEHHWQLRRDPPAGMIRAWTVLGAFPAIPAQGLLRSGPVAEEGGLYPGGPPPPAGTAWQTVAAAATGMVDLTAPGLAFRPNEHCVAYAHVFIQAPALTAAELRLGSDDGIAAWLNGSMVWANEVHRGFTADQDRVPVLLGAGWNRLLLKISNGVGGWAFGARLLAADGSPLASLVAESANPLPGPAPFPVPTVPARLVGLLAAVDLNAATLRGEGEGIVAPLTVTLRNLGGRAEQPLAVRLQHGQETVQDWLLPSLDAGQTQVHLPLSPELWTGTLLQASAPLTVEAGGQTAILTPPEPVGFLAALLEGGPETSDRLGLRSLAEDLAQTPRRWETRALPAPDCRTRGRLFLDLALHGAWGRLAEELARDRHAAVAPDAGRARWRTSFQAAAARVPEVDARPDAVMVYGLADTERRVREWRRFGYQTQLMTGIAWGSYQDYLYGRFDGQNHEDDAQQDRDGNRITHGGDVYYMVPTQAYTEYLCSFIAKSFALPLDGICLEEPEFWMRGGWSPAFRREWQAFYGEPWQPPDSSVDACYRAAALKKELYRRCLETVCGYVRREKPDWECIVATHSLINYANWGIASPESALATIPACDTVIAQVWSDTILTPCLYDGRRASRPFANAYLEFAQMVAMITPTGMSLAFLADPVADNGRLDWQTCRRSYEDTVAAGLLCPEVNRFEIMPWPDRVFRAPRPPNDEAEPDETVTMPPGYATELLAVVNALRLMPLGAADAEEAGAPLALAVADSLMYQRGTVNGRAEDFGNFFGLALPLLQRGLLIKLVQLEHLRAAGDLGNRKVLVLSYNGMKSPTPEVHDYLAEWVRGGGVLVFSGDGQDTFRTVREWWNRPPLDCDCPSEHLFARLGLDARPAVGWHAVGRGHVFVGNEAPRAFAEAGAHTRLAAVVQEASAKAGIAKRYAERNRMLLRRGPYVVGARLTESVAGEPPPLPGTYISLFSDDLALTDDLGLAPGRCGLWVDVGRVPVPAVAASASRVRQWAVAGRQAVFTSVAPLGTRTVTWLRLPAEPQVTRAATHAGIPVAAMTRWLQEPGLLRLEHVADPDGIDVTVGW